MDQTYVRVDKDEKTVIPVPLLNNVVSPPDKLLSNNSYIIIQNNSSFAVSLVRVSNILLPDNLSGDRVNSGERALYTILNNDSRNVSLYSLSENARTINFPPNLINFDPGRVYSFVYDGSNISLISILEIKLDNVLVGSQDDPVNKTWVRFVNTNDFSVSMFSDRQRMVKIADAAENDLSLIQTDPNISGAIYYPTYNIIIEDVSIPYEGGLIVTRIDAGRTEQNPNVVYIPLLDELSASEFEKPLSTSAYIKIQNAAGSSLSLRQGQFDLFPAGAMSSIINGGETALYIISPGSVSDYSLRRNTIEPVGFPNELTEFEGGKLYSIRFDGTKADLLTVRPLTLSEAFAISPPENITARSLPSGSIALNWDRVGIETSYRIFRSIGNTDNFVFLTSTANTSITDNDVELGNTYYYKLSSVKSSLESDMSVNYASALSEESSLLAPTGITASTQGANSILLSWNSVPDAVSYMIHRGNSSGNINTYVTTTASLSYTVSGLNPDTGYWFTVTASNNSMISFPSQPVYGITALPLPPPTGLSASALSSSSIQVLWNSVTSATGYNVYRSGSANGTYSFAGTVTSSPFTDNGLSGNTAYFYKVSALREMQEGDMSDHVSATTMQAPITPPGSTLSEQLAFIRSNSGDGTVFEIVVYNNEYMGPTSISTMGRNINVNIRSASSASPRTIQLDGQGHLFSVDSNITLRLQDIVLRGHSNNNVGLVGVGSGGALVLNSGAKVTQNVNRNGNQCGGGIYINGGYLELNDGAEITENSVVERPLVYGGGIYVENKGSVNIYGGLVSENTASGNGTSPGGVGGGICITGNSTINMWGGIISKNLANHAGGGIYIENGSSFIKRAALGSNTSGVIYGGTGGEANVATRNNQGHAIRRNFGTLRNRNTTLGGFDEISTGNDVGWE